MNKYFNQTIAILLLVSIAILPSCKKDLELNTNIGTVKTLYAPDDAKSIKLQPATSAALLFEWESAKAEDGTLVQYEVVFDKEGGDFSNPIFKKVSDGNGVQTTLTMSHKELNKIANLAGIGSLETGILKWTIFSFKGQNSKKADQARAISVERPAGFSEIPADVYITGSATEAGANLSDAIKMTATANGVFEVFTKLKAGTYHFVDKKSGTPNSFSIQGTAIKEGGENTQANEKIYRIRLDFNNAANEVTEITKVGLYMPAGWANNNVYIIGNLDYKGNGTWEVLNLPIKFLNPGWPEERYKFQFDTKDADGVAGSEFYGSINVENSNRPDDPNTPLSYFKLMPQPANAPYIDWSYTYKFASALDGKNCDVRLFLNSDVEFYYHETKIK
ncbi:MAG TPA: SusE domain-containing protein [Hanamia sp.]